jgi:hypothetical protein
VDEDDLAGGRRRISGGGGGRRDLKAPAPEIVAALTAASAFVPDGPGLYAGKAVRDVCALPALSVNG